MGADGLLIRDQDGITVLTLDRPPVNALDLRLLESLVRTLEGMRADPPRALVLAGRGRAFSAGLDLRRVPHYDQAEQRRMVEALNAMVLALYAMPCPVVAALTGHAIAGGFVIALCADYRIACQEARYGLTELKVGVPYPVGPLGVAAAELSATAVRILVLGAETQSAQTCLALGALDETHPTEAVLDRALIRATQMACHPAALYSRTKAAVRAKALTDIEAAAREEPLRRSWLSSAYLRPEAVLARPQ